MWHDAAKLDWLRGRPDFQEPEHQRFLDRLELTYPEHDALYPWLARERKKGRLKDPYASKVNERFPDENEHTFGQPMQFTDKDGRQATLDPDTLDQVNDWMKYMKQAGKGVDIMANQIGPAVHEARKADVGGEVVHEFPSGHKILKLRNKRDMRTEGQRMHHCVGSNGMGYLEKNENGDGMYYSLRDPYNEPLGTAEVEPTKEQYYKCPSCGKFAMGEYGYGEGGQRTLDCENCGHTLWDRITNEAAEGVETHPLSLKGKKHPDASYTTVAQMFGPHDHKMDPYHNDLFNEYFKEHGHVPYESDGEEEEDEEFEPWWDSEYHAEGPTTPEEYLNHAEGEYHDFAPDEYERAVSDAYDHDMEPPDLYPGQPDYDSIFEQLNTDPVDPQQINDVWKAAEQNGDIDEFNHRARQWLDDEYEPYLDPYGQHDGPGVLNPNNDGLAFNEPGTHYPGQSTYPNEEYFARNLTHHLQKYTDPQTGREYDQKYQLDNKYPQHVPELAHGETPRLLDKGTPIPDQTGPTMVGVEEETPYGYRNRVRDIELPYGRGTDIGPSATDDAFPGMQERTQRPIPRDIKPEKPFTPSGPLSPETYFGPGQENIYEHQRAIPGMTWTDKGGPSQFDNDWEDTPPSGYPPMLRAPYNPNDAYHYPRGQQQGTMWPSAWYIDYAKKRAQETELPEHLFPPEHFGYHQPEGQTSLWRNSEMTGGGAFLTTQPHVPHTHWQAKTASPPPAGPWTRTEEEGGLPRPENDPNTGYGIWGQDVHQGVPHLNGRIIEHNAPNPSIMPGFDWRRPVVYDRNEDRLYVGQHGMEHGDMMQSFHKPNPWGANFDLQNTHLLPGYIDTKGHVGGGLHFFNNEEVPNAEQFHDWVEGQHGVRAQSEEYPPEWNDDLFSTESSYHPRQADEWVADDEPDFSASIPEPRWNV